MKDIVPPSHPPPPQKKDIALNLGSKDKENEVVRNCSKDQSILGNVARVNRIKACSLEVPTSKAYPPVLNKDFYKQVFLGKRDLVNASTLARSIHLHVISSVQHEV